MAEGKAELHVLIVNTIRVMMIEKRLVDAIVNDVNYVQCNELGNVN